MIYTSYFGNIRKLPKDMILYSIAGKTPEWFANAKNVNYRQYKALAPKYSWWKEWKDSFTPDYESDESKAWYEEKYRATVLSSLDARKVASDLVANGDDDVCLLCYETPEKFCHRHIVAKWLNENGIECKEI